MIPNKVLALIEQINNEYGDGTIVLLGKNKQYQIERFSTGLAQLDTILEGGMPKKIIVELYGNPSDGKSSLATVIGASVQKTGGVVAYIDAENSFRPEWASRFGFDANTVLLNYPKSGEEAINLVLTLMRNNIDLIIVDSVAALAPIDEIEEDEGVEAVKVALLPRIMSKAMRLVQNSLPNSNSTIIFINQYTTTIGRTPAYMPVQLQTKGGLALRQAAHLRLQLTRTEYIKNTKAEKLGIKKGIIGQIIQIRVEKSKVSTPFRMATWELLYYQEQELQKMGIHINGKKAT